VQFKTENDLSDGVVHHCQFYLYGVDCALFLPDHINDDPAHSHEPLNIDIDNICKWSEKWKLKFKASKSILKKLYKKYDISLSI
jgi:hypothetical protein